MSNIQTIQFNSIQFETAFPNMSFIGHVMVGQVFLFSVTGAKKTPNPALVSTPPHNPPNIFTSDLPLHPPPCLPLPACASTPAPPTPAHPTAPPSPPPSPTSPPPTPSSTPPSSTTSAPPASRYSSHPSTSSPHTSHPRPPSSCVSAATQSTRPPPPQPRTSQPPPPTPPPRCSIARGTARLLHAATCR